MARIQQSLIAAQELGDEKLQVVTQLQETIDLKTRQLDADFKNLDYNAKDEQASIDRSPKDTRPSSPMSYTPSSSNNQKIGDSRGDDGVLMAMSTNSSANDRITVASSSNSSSNTNSSNANKESNWKRSRRVRNDVTAPRGTNSNAGSSASKSQSDLLNESNASSTNQTKSSSLNTSQQNSGGNVSNSSQNKKQSGNSGGSKKRKRKSGRAQNMGGSGGNNNSGNNANNNQGNARLHDVTPPLDDTIDPDEPTYCLCDQISFGEMILCDNDLCPIEWFHFSCVSLTTKPKGKWFCPNCRGERQSVMKPKQQFLKELERYNREKEEKT